MKLRIISVLIFFMMTFVYADIVTSHTTAGENPELRQEKIPHYGRE